MSLNRLTDIPVPRVKLEISHNVENSLGYVAMPRQCLHRIIIRIFAPLSVPCITSQLSI